MVIIPIELKQDLLNTHREFNNAMQEHKEIHWTFDPVHCNIRFVAPHLFIFEVESAFLSFTGSVTSNDDIFPNAAIAFEINAASIKTSSDIRGNNLRSDNFFNIPMFPKIRFQSLSFLKVLDDQYKLLMSLPFAMSQKQSSLTCNKIASLLILMERSKLASNSVARLTGLPISQLQSYHQ